MTDLHALLSKAADDLVPEHDPLGWRVDGVRRLVGRRRAVRRVQAGAGALVGVAVIGGSALWALPGLDEPVQPGTPSATTDPSTAPTPDAPFAPVCGEMIPAVAENPMWASLAADAASFMPADPDTPYEGGMSVDITLGTIATEPVAGELSAEVVLVLTDLDGTVVTWWRASEHGRPLDLGPEIDLAPEGVQPFEGFGWFPVVDTCGGGAPIADGDYRLFAWVSAAVRVGDSDVLEQFPVLSAPLDVTVGDGVLTQL